MDVIARMTSAEDRAFEPTVRAALGDGLELIRELVTERHRRHDLDGQLGDARAGSFCYDPPCPDE